MGDDGQYYRRDQDFIKGVDLGQTTDYTAIAIVEALRVATGDPELVNHSERMTVPTHYHPRPSWWTEPAVTDKLEADGLQPYSGTIHGGDDVIRDGKYFRVPKRDLVGVLIALYQSGRFKVAKDLPPAAVLNNELLNFKIKTDLRTAHDPYEAWRASVHDDLVLAVALACWYTEHELLAVPRRRSSGPCSDWSCGHHQATDCPFAARPAERAALFRPHWWSTKRSVPRPALCTRMGWSASNTVPSMAMGHLGQIRKPRPSLST